MRDPPFIRNLGKISGLKWSMKITDHFRCTSANVIHCITCTLCKKLYIGETGRQLGYWFWEHLRDIEKNDRNPSKPVARHFNLPNHTKQHMAVCGLSLHQGSTESRKTLEQKFIFQIGALIILTVSTNTFHSTNLFCWRSNARNVSFQISLWWPIYIINSVDKTKLSCNTPTDAAPQFL